MKLAWHIFDAGIAMQPSCLVLLILLICCRISHHELASLQQQANLVAPLTTDIKQLK